MLRIIPLSFNDFMSLFAFLSTRAQEAHGNTLYGQEEIEFFLNSGLKYRGVRVGSGPALHSSLSGANSCLCRPEEDRLGCLEGSQQPFNCSGGTLPPPQSHVLKYKDKHVIFMDT